MRLYNTLERKKQEFEPLNGNTVNMYVCGITAYDLCHIGNARSSVVFDAMVRYLRYRGYDVNFIKNFTDVDDKIIKRAHETGMEPGELAAKFIDEFNIDMQRLNVLRADVEPKCTEHIAEMVELTERLIEKGHAYATDDGDVYFRVRSFADYGKLSGRNVDEMEAGARVELGETKEDPLDFALWKSAKPGEPSWESPWGLGRPGWHLECSAMSEKYAPLPLDIHGGGQDLAFPHHENEIAQTEAATGKPFSRFWVHNGFVQINFEKMSKSLGNFFTTRELMNKFMPEALRYFLLSNHYRSPLDFSFDALEEAEKGLKRVYSALAQIDAELTKTKWKKSPFPEELETEMDAIEAKWTESMEDDLNTAAALGQIFNAVRLAGRVLEDKSLRKSEGAKKLWARIADRIRSWSDALGLFGSDPEKVLEELRNVRAARKGIDPAVVQAKLDERLAARKEKDFARSDELRDELAAMGVEVKDTPTGATWDV
ncbi:cysteine--tRNA ligase [Pseudodesulfovibrio senegalensis]|uniref:Cysteine--tRNA ligase n=1 Tax=Pseudodesulfovibrio senegalensis TaxID=1721087 RepID=A0A6N6N0T6_9BACT|nr:cysteine--tRNA ligase [Pseudodesulfovibrio senegalensis]KAB1439036.1 cysteine--tRNA ligase [Pseudodesulfovibrio senegalensis]